MRSPKPAKYSRMPWAARPSTRRRRPRARRRRRRRARRGRRGRGRRARAPRRWRCRAAGASPSRRPTDPLEHARVLAEAGPQELAVGVLAEPVHAVDRGQRRLVGALRHAQPVGEVVAHVVAAERQHRERVAAQVADPPGRRPVFSEPMVAADEHAVLPVVRLEHERHGGGAPAAEEERRDRHALRVLPLGGDRRALRRRARRSASSGARPGRPTRASTTRPASR